MPDIQPDEAVPTPTAREVAGHTRRVGFEEASSAIKAGTARAHALWALISTPNQRDGYAIRPSPWEGSGEYQYVSYDGGRDVFVRIPDDEGSLPVATARAGQEA